MAREEIGGSCWNRSMGRDDFSRPVIDRLAKRAGMRCSNPDCRAPTSGPSFESPSAVTNTGVAAHICAASPGGARYNSEMTPEQRSDISNAIWLCQTHAKLIDDDELSFPAAMLLEWKATAEQIASLEARGFAVSRAKPFSGLEKKAPKLIAEMREDLRQYPLVRQFVILRNKRIGYSMSYRQFMYFEEEHQDLRSVMTIMVHTGAIYGAQFNDTPDTISTKTSFSSSLETKPSLPDVSTQCQERCTGSQRLLGHEL